jgi:hypothetical protein
LAAEGSFPRIVYLVDGDASLFAEVVLLAFAGESRKSALI